MIVTFKKQNLPAPLSRASLNMTQLEHPSLRRCGDESCRPFCAWPCFLGRALTKSVQQRSSAPASQLPRPSAAAYPRVMPMMGRRSCAGNILCWQGCTCGRILCFLNFVSCPPAVLIALLVASMACFQWEGALITRKPTKESCRQATLLWS